jgi:acyl carrier protein
MTTGIANSRDELRAWLVERIAGYLGVSKDTLDTGTPLAEAGMDSVYALTLCGDIEDTFGLPVEPTLAWDHPTIDAITEVLFGDLSASGASGGRGE